MFTGSFIFTLKIVCTAFAFALLFRAYIRYLGLPANDKFAAFAIYATDWAVTPAAAFIPRYKNWPLPPLFVCYLTAIVYKFFFWLMGSGSFGLGSMIFGSAVLVLYWAVDLAIWIALAFCLVSWLAPASPTYRLLGILTDPYLGIFRKYIPPYKNIDVSAIAFFFLGSIVNGILWKFV